MIRLGFEKALLHLPVALMITVYHIQNVFLALTRTGGGEGGLKWIRLIDGSQANAKLRLLRGKRVATSDLFGI